MRCIGTGFSSYRRVGLSIQYLSMYLAGCVTVGEDCSLAKVSLVETKHDFRSGKVAIRNNGEQKA